MNYDRLMQIAYCNNVSVLQLTESLCRDAIENNIPGDFAEAGVAVGAHCLVMNEVAQGSKKVYMFDSFEGISVHGDNDVEWTEAYGKSVADPRKSGGITVCKIENVKKTMLQYVSNLDNFAFVEGWFIDTLPKLTDEKFSVLRLDVDLYDPYMLCFKYLLPRLSENGWLIIDDVTLSGCKYAVEDSGLDLTSFIFLNNIAYLKWTWDERELWEARNTILDFKF